MILVAEKRKSPVHCILMSTDCIGGVWTFSIQLAKALSFYGIDVVLASMGDSPTPGQKAEVASLRNVRLFHDTCKLEWMVDPWEDVSRAGEWLLRIEAEVCPDLVHLNGYSHASLPWRSPVLVAGHSCVYSWFRAVHGCNPPSEWERYRTAISEGLQAAGGVTAPTFAMLRCLSEIYGPFHSLGAVYNGREEAAFLPGRKVPVIFSAGRLWDEAKNTAALEYAASRIPWPVYVAGETVHPDGGVRRLKNMNHLGQLSPLDLAKWLGRSSIYVLPARYEPFGLTALEAGLAGCALVLGDIPTLREVWEDSALFVPPERPDILAEVLKDLIRHEDHLEMLSSKARKKALRYTPERMARGYVGLYEKMVDEAVRHNGPFRQSY